MKLKSIIIGVLLTCFLFSLIFPQGIIPSPNLSEANGTPLLTIDSNPAIGGQNSPIPPPEGPIYSNGQYQYEGMGTTLSTTEYAQGSNLSLQVSDFNYGEDEYGEMRLPAGWTGYQLDANVYNLFDQPYFMYGSLENGNFESIHSEWDDYSIINPPDNSSNPYYGTRWGPSCGYSGNGVRTWIEWWSGFNWNTTQYIAFNNTISIQRDDPEYAKLTFRVRVNLISGSSGARGRLVVYAEVAGIVYRQLLDERCPNNGQWYNLNISIPYDDLLTWSVPEEDIIVRLGLSWTGIQSSWDYEYWALDFDDVTLEVRGKVNPTHAWLNLQMNSTIAQTADYGIGTYSETGTWTNPTTVHDVVLALWEAMDNDARLVSFDYDLTLYITKDATTEQQVGPDGSQFVVRNNTAVYWTTWVYAYQPYFFENYNLSITRPTTETWTLHEVTDTLFNDRTSVVTTTSTHFELSTTAVNDVYGWWNFTLTSTNRVSSISTNFDTFRISPGSPSTLTVDATLSVSSGQANLTLYDPTGYPVNESSQTVTSTTVNFPNIQFTDGTTYPAGEYTICISYDDGDPYSITSAGFQLKIISIEHATSLTPDDPGMWVTYADSGYFYPRVQFLDTDTNLPITGATVNGTVAGNPISFYASGGYYDAQIAKSFLNPGDYILYIDANKTYFDSQSTSINLYIRGGTSLTSPESPGLTVPYDEIFTVQVKYWDIYNDTGITGATITTTGWPSTVVTPTGTAGWYNLTVDTTDKPAPGTYSLSIQGTLNYYQNQTLVLTIVIREVSTTITYTPPGSVPWDEDVVISFDYSVNDPDSQHDGTGLNGASITAQLDGTPLVEGINYTLSDLGGGQYTLTILSASGVIDTVKSYSLTIQITPADSKYSDATRTINFTVRALETSITYDPPQPTPWGEDQVITFYYTVDDPDSSHDGEGIIGVTSLTGTTLDGSALLGGEYTLVDNGGGQYTLTILYSSGRINSVKSYTLQLYVISPSSEYISNSRQITFVIRALITQVTFDPISSTPWSEDVVVTFYYRVSDTASSQHDTGIPGVTNITGSTLDGAPLLGGDYTLVDNGGGQYTLTILYSSGMINSITSYSLYLFVNTPDAQHENAAQTTSLTVRTLATQITYNPVIPVPWSENIIITFYYSVNDPASSQHGNGITDVTDISGSTLDGTPLTGGDYTLVDNGGGQYTLTILYSSGLITTIKTYSLYIYVNSPDSQHNDANQTIGFTIRAIQTFVTYDAVSPTPYGENVEITFYYTVNDPTSSQDGTGITGVTNVTGSTLDGSLLNPGEYTLVDNGGGQYTLTILYSSGLITTIKTYSLNLYVNSPDTQHEDSTQTISFTIRSLRTSISFDPIPQTPWGEDVVITFYYVINDLDSSNDGTGISGVTSIAGSTLDTVALNPGEYTLVDEGSGQYTLTILYSSGVISTIKSYSLALHVDSPSAEYNSANRTTTFTVRVLGTKISYTPPLPTPWGQDVIITVFYLVEDTSSAQHGNGITGVTSITGTTLDGIPLIAGEFTLVDNGGGQYTLTLLYSSGRLSSIKTYTLELHFDASAAQYADADQTITFDIRTLTTQVTIDPPTQTPWSDDVVITFYYRISDLASIEHGNGIPGVTNITESTLDAVLLDPIDYTLVDNGGGQYTLTILYSSGKINDVQTYSLYLYVNSQDTQHDDASQTITFDVRTLATEITYDPVIPVPWSEDVVIIFYYKVNDPSSSQHGNGIAGVTSIAGSQLEGTPLLVTDYTLVDNGGGQYTLTLLYTSGLINSIKTYTLDLYVVAPDSQHEDADQTITFEIRTIRTFVTYDAVSPTPYGEDVEIIFYYIVNDPTSSQDGTGITGVTNITGSTLDAIALDPGDYTLIDNGGGQYTLTILLSSGKLSSVKLYSLSLFIVSPDTQHENASQTISFRVRTLRTSISFDPISQTPWGEDVIITFYYVINDLESSNDGNGIPGVTSITGSTLDGGALNPGEYTLVDNGAGQYTLTILYSSGVISSIKSYSLALHVDTPSTEYNAADRSTSFAVRQLGTKISYTSPLPTPWGQDVAITVYYLVEDTSSAQHGNGITGVLDISGSTLDTIAIVAGDFTLADNGGGQYTLTLLYSSGKLDNIKTYTLELHFVAPAVQYADADQTITFDIRTLITQVTIDPPTQTPWSDDVVITFYYRVSDLASIQHGNGIPGVTNITGSTLDAVLFDPGDYILVDNGGGQYTLTILYGSSKINNIQSYSLYLYVNAPDAQHEDASQTVSFTVRTLSTEITYTPVIPVPWSEDIAIIFYYSVNDPSSSQHGNGITGVTSIAGSELDGSSLLVTDYTLVDNGGGQYTLTLLYSSGHINSIKSYSLYLYVVSPDSQHDYADQTIGFSVRAIRTFVTYDAVSPTPYGEDVEITFYYTVNDPTSSHDGSGIIGVTSITGSTLDAVALDPGDYTLVDNGGGQYTLTILFSSGEISSVKLYSLSLYVVSPDVEYENASQTISFSVRTLRTSISFDPIPQTPWGEDIVITFYYVINDLDSSNDGTGITGVTSIAGSTLDAVPLNPGEYLLVGEGSGQYTLTILFSSGVISNIQSYSLVLHVVTPSAEYDAADRTTSFTVRLLGTKITYTPPLPTPWGQDVNITVFYLVEDTSSAQHGSGITGVISLAGSLLDGAPLNPGEYTLVDNGGGQYTLILLYSSGRLSNIKPYILELHFDAPAVQYADADQTITFDIRALTTQVTIDPPSPTPWGDDVVITFYYRVSDLASIQHGSGITGLTDISGSMLVGVPLIITDYILADEGAGQYTLTILYSSGGIDNIQTYSLYLYVNAPTSNYDDADRSGQFDVRSIVTLVSYTPSPPVPRGTNVIIVFNYRVNDPASSQHGTGITGVTSLTGSLLDGGALNLGEYTLVENGGGQYTLTILFSSGRISSIKAYSLDLYVNSPDTQHDDATVNIGFEIRTIRTAITYDPVGSTAWSLDVVIVFNYIVDDSASGEDGNGITGVMSIAGSLLDGSVLDPSDYTLVDNGGGQYTLTILYSSTKISTVKIYSLALHVITPDAYHQDANQTIGFRIRNHYIASDIDPITTIPWQNNGSMVLRVNDDDLSTPLPDVDLIALRILGPTTLYIDSGNWTEWVENGLPDDGIFTITIDTTGWALGTHTLDVYVYTSASYENDTVYTAATIRALATSFTYQSPPVVAWGEDGILEINYTVSDTISVLNENPITGATISIATLTVGVDFSYLDNVDGTYTITIFATELLNNQTYYFNISISSPVQYTNRALTKVPITVRALFTTLAYSRVPTTPFGDNVTVDVQYFILDGQSSKNGAFISGATITVMGIGGLTLLPSDYSVTPYAGYYRITITKALSIGSYEIEVAAYHATDPYRSARISNPPMSFDIRPVYTEIEKEPVDAAPYGENFSITIIYRVRDDASSQDGDGITGSDQITIYTNGTWANPSYSLSDLGNGQYFITIKSDQTPSPGSYWINITLGWIADTPNYEEQWVGVWLTSDYRETRIINSNPPDTNYADNVVVYLNYTDVLDDWGIDNTTTGPWVRIRILHAANDSEISATYYIEDITFGIGWTEPTLYYRVLINASELGAVNVIFNLKIEASWVAGNTPFYTMATKAFSVRTVGTETILYSETIQTEPTGNDIIINLHYETTGGGLVTNGSGYVGILVECDDIAGWDGSYWYVPASSWPGTDGNYTLIIRGSINFDVGTYSFRITLTWPTGFDPQYYPYYASAEAFVSARVREIRTTLDWSQPSTLYYSQWLVIEALFQDRDHGFENITDVIWSIDVGLTYNYTQRGDGTWVIMIDTTGLAAGAFSFYLTATKTNYEEQIRDVDITIHRAPLSLMKIDPTGSNIIVYWGELIPVTVYLEDALTGTPMTPANNTEIIYKWYTSDWALMTYTGTPGYYTISPTLDTGLAEATGTQLIIQTNMTDYETEFFIFTVSIQAVNTRLDIPPGNSTAIQVYIEDNITLFVTFWSVYENGTFWNFLNNAKIRALNASTSDVLKNFTFIADGTYYCEFDTSDWRIQPQTITVTAGAVNTIPQQITFTITVRYKPCEIIVEQPAYSANYTENVIINIFLNDTREASQWNPIDGHSLYLIWQGNPCYFNPNGTAGWYYCSFPANATPSTQARTISIYHPIYLKYSDSSTSVPLTISKAATELQIINAYSQVTIDGIEYMISVPFYNPSWFIPIGDTLVLTFDYKDMSNNSLLEEEVLSKYVEFFAIKEFDFDSISGYWTVHFQFNTTVSSELRIRFTSDYYVDKEIIKSLEVGLIPMELSLVEAIPNLIYVGTTYSFGLYLNDTYHNAPVSGADLTYEHEGPIGADIQILPDPLHPGYYNITISANSESSTTLTFSADKFNYGLINEIESFVSIQLTEFMRDLIFYGSIGAVVVVIALIGWILWARVYSIPWEVRRLRKLAKAIEKDENYKLGRKDLKRFHAREATMESKIDMAMGTIGVAATPAMIPRTEEVEEISASEEDIMTELDKIPGLGPEEKTVLANEMRKIPRKDRIWFLDDLKRQMGQRRMDFLTQREEPITPPPAPKEAPPKPVPKEAPPKPAPVEKPPVKPEVPPLEEVPPTEPPEPKTVEKDRTAPTVLPPELQEAPAVPEAVIAEIRRELDKIPNLNEPEKAALVDHLKYLSKTERQATYNSLRQNADMDS